MKNTDHGIDYICTHLGEENAAHLNYGAVIPPIYETSLHVFENMEGLLGLTPPTTQDRYIYGRVSNPTTHLLEQKLAALEGADGALCFASGMAAISSAILSCVKPGDHVVSIQNVYGPTRNFLTNYLHKFGIESTFVTGTDPMDFERAIRPNTTMFYLESPSTAVMELQDLIAVAQIAKAHGIRTAIDNTWATPVYQKPLSLGIDITLHTMSKYIGGHSDIIGGVLCANAEIIESIQHNERELLGGILGPFEAWLGIRGLRTLPLRLKQSGANALKVAQYLENHPRTLQVNYPGVTSHPQYDLAQRQMSGSSGLLSVALDATPEQVIEVGNRLQLFRKGVSWGGFESLASMPMYRMSVEEAKARNGCPQLLRLYCGVEDSAELLDDLDHALSMIR